MLPEPTEMLGKTQPSQAMGARIRRKATCTKRIKSIVLREKKETKATKVKIKVKNTLASACSILGMTSKPAPPFTGSNNPGLKAPARAKEKLQPPAPVALSIKNWVIMPAASRKTPQMLSEKLTSTAITISFQSA